MREAIESLRLIVGDVSRETFDSLVDLQHELVRWNSQINLVSPKTIDQIWDRHILDSAQLFPLAGEVKEWVDIGSGGGFPGLVLAILRKPYADLKTSLVESNQKKAGFLRHFAGKASLGCDVYSERIEHFVSENPAPDVISARALTSLEGLLELTGRWIDEGATGIFHKGRDYVAEIEQSSAIHRYDLIEHASAVDADSVILEIKRKKHDS